MTHPDTKTPETTAAFDPTSLKAGEELWVLGRDPTGHTYGIRQIVPASTPAPPASADAWPGGVVRSTRCVGCPEPINCHNLGCQGLKPISALGRYAASLAPSHTGTAESDDAAFVERMSKVAGTYYAVDSEMGRLIALARRATTKSERDGVTELRDSLEEILDYRGGAENALEDEYVIDRARAALARTPAADNDGAAMRAENAKLRKALESTERALSFWKEQAK